MTVTDIRLNQKNRKRVSVFVDNSFGFSCYIETMQDEALRVGGEVTDDDIVRIRRLDGELYAWQAALRILDRGWSTERQMREKLARREIDPEVIDTTVTRLHDCGLLNDAEYAERYAEQLYQKYGKWAVAQKLRARGVPRDIVVEVCQSPGSEAVLVAQAARLLERHRSEGDLFKRRQKVARSLATRGFAYDDINRAIRECEEAQKKSDPYEE